MHLTASIEALNIDCCNNLRAHNRCVFKDLSDIVKNQFPYGENVESGFTSGT